MSGKYETQGIHLTYLSLNISTEKTMRKTACQLCPSPIMKGTRRVAIRQPQFRTPFKAPSQGGRIAQNEWFAHPQCFVRSLGIEGKPKSQCVDCLEPLDKLVNFVNTGPRDGNYPICVPCVRSGRWRFCQSCQLWTKIRDTSPLVRDGVVTNVYYCDSCAGNNLHTEKNLKRDRRAAR